jgi:hypothetical protein
MRRNATREIVQVNFQTRTGHTWAVFGNHWPSRSAGQFESAGYRQIAGETLSFFHQRVLEVHGPDPPVLAMGDLNDEPFDVSLVTHALSTRQRRRVLEADHGGPRAGSGGGADGHLGYEKGDPAGRGSPNSRNGHSGKTVATEVGDVSLAVPRDWAGTFEPRLVPKGARRAGDLDDMIISLYAGGMTIRDIGHHLVPLGNAVRLRSLRVFVDQPVEDLPATDPCCAEIDDGGWPGVRGVGWALIAALMRSALVVVHDELAQDGEQVPRAVDQYPVQTLPAHGAHPAFRIRVGPSRRMHPMARVGIDLSG